MSDADLVNAKRDLLTKIVADYSSRQVVLKADVAAAEARLDAALSAENAEAVSLAQVQNQLDGLALQADLASLEATQASLTTKAASFATLVQTNNATAATIFDAVKASQDVVDQISRTIDDIRANLASIGAAIDLATAASAATTKSVSV